jgi:HEAT repeat protein
MKRVGTLLTLWLVIGAVGLSTMGFARQNGAQENAAADTSGDLSKEIAALHSADPVQRASAACSLRKMRERAVPAITSLVSILGDETSIGEFTCEQAGRSNPAFARPKTTSPGREAAKALAVIGKPSVDPVIGALGESDAKVRRNAVWVLGELKASYPAGQDPRVPVIVGSLSDTEAEVRAAAAWALAEIKPRSAGAPLIASLHDSDPATRKNAAWALGEIRDSSALDALIAALKDEQWEVRKNSAWALGEMKKSAAIEPLTAALHDAHAEVRNTASWALQEIKGGGDSEGQK